MRNIRLRINNKVYGHLMWFLKRFTSDEIQVIDEDENFVNVQTYLKAELEKMENGTAGFIGVEELYKELEATLKKYES